MVLAELVPYVRWAGPTDYRAPLSVLYVELVKSQLKRAPYRASYAPGEFEFEFGVRAGQ